MHGGEQWHAHTQKKQELEGSDNDLNFWKIYSQETACMPLDNFLYKSA